MAYCGPRGIPYSEFMGGPPGWDDVSRQLALAWDKRERSRCGGCGVPYMDWYLEDGTPDDTAYIREEYVCPGCEKRNSGVKDAGSKVTVVRNPSAPLWQE